MRITRKRLSRIIREEAISEIASRRSVSRWTDIYPGLVNSNVIKEGDEVIIVNGPEQSLYIVDSSENNINFSTKVSTGAKGFGNASESGQTSTGLMYVSNIVGKGGPENAVYVGKRLTDPIITIDTNKPSPRPGHKAEVLTRILVLKGLEGENKNVFGRSIYIHGTNLEYTLGSPHSGGCVRVSNRDIINLADGDVSPGMHVYVYSGRPQSMAFEPESIIDESDENKDGNVEHDSEDIGTVDGIPATSQEIEDVLSQYPVEDNA